MTPPIWTSPAVASSRSPEKRVAKKRLARMASSTPARVFSVTQSPAPRLTGAWPKSLVPGG